MRQVFGIGMGMGLLLGGGVGFYLGYQQGSASRSGAPAAAQGTPAAMPAIPAAPPSMPGGGLPVAPAATPAQEQQAFLAQQAAERNPKDPQAWVAVGNAYFDLHRPKEAAAAYEKALALKPGDPNVLTDMGVMYRELKAFDKAVEAFRKASKADPKHLQSLFNLGVVYAYDLKDRAKAEEAWSRVAALDPGGEQGQRAKQGLEALKSGQLN